MIGLRRLACYLSFVFVVAGVGQAPAMAADENINGYAEDWGMGGSNTDDPFADPGTSPVSVPACDLSGPATYCMGEYSCRGGVTTLASAAVTIREAHLGVSPEDLFPVGPKPKDAIEARWLLCTSPGGGLIMNRYWVTPGVASLVDRARVAVTKLPFPKVAVAYSVGGDTYDDSVTYVNTPTYWWVKGAAGVEIRSPEAAGLVAHAKPLNLTIDPGDGSGSTVCSWQTGNANNSSTCQHEYEKTSLYDGEHVHTIKEGPYAGKDIKAYQASMTPQWEIWFTLEGTRIPIPGLPTTQNSVPVTANVPVDEIQSLAGPQQ